MKPRRILLLVPLGLIVLFLIVPSFSGVVPTTASEPDLRISLKVGTINTSYQTEVPGQYAYRDLVARPLPSGQLLFIVQFEGPVDAAWVQMIRQAGAELRGHYVPNFGYVARLLPAQAENIRRLPHVRAVIALKPAYKAAPSLSQQAGSMVVLGVEPYSQDDLPEIVAAVQALGGSVQRVLPRHRGGVVQAAVSRAAIPELLRSEHVIYVEPYQSPTELMVQTQWANQSYQPGQMPIWNRGLSGSGEIIAAHEAGDYEFESNNCFFDQANNKVRFYGPPPSPCRYGINLFGCYHRLHVLAAAVGDAPPYGTPNTGEFSSGLGHTGPTYDTLAYRATAILGPASSDLYTFLSETTTMGARLANLSWRDSDGSGDYTLSARLVDEFSFQTMLAGNHTLVFAAAGNEGNVSPNGIVSPATAKNAVTVGATERHWTGKADSSLENMVDFSSYGPARDGRIKPDVTAIGLKFQGPGLDFSGVNQLCENLGEVYGNSGTSFASPIAASAGALIREYYKSGYYPGGATDPSAALVKATLINSGRNMTGGNGRIPPTPLAPIPGAKQGWGRITLEDALNFREPGEFRVVDDLVGLITGQQSIHTVQVPPGSPVWELKVTLVWTDWPGNVMANPALVNDLDLTVSGPSGAFKGNWFLGGYSQQGGNYDRLNPVEQVYLSSFVGNLQPGQYTITVSGYNVPCPCDAADIPLPGRQPFALVVNLRHTPHEQLLPVALNSATNELPPPGEPYPPPSPPYP